MTPQQIFSYIKPKKDYTETGLDVDYKIEVNHERKSIELYLKETDSKLDWYLNFNFLPMRLKIGEHKFSYQKGFALIYLSSKNKILSEYIKLCEFYKDYTPTMYGWSLGTTQIPLLALDFYYRTGRKVVNPIGFGTPKALYSRKMKKIFNDKISDYIEYCQPNDFVCWVNPFCTHINPKWVGQKFNIIKIFKTAENHCNYDRIKY